MNRNLFASFSVKPSSFCCNVRDMQLEPIETPPSLHQQRSVISKGYWFLFHTSKKPTSLLSPAWGSSFLSFSFKAKLWTAETEGFITEPPVQAELWPQCNLNYLCTVLCSDHVHICPCQSTSVLLIKQEPWRVHYKSKNIEFGMVFLVLLTDRDY